MKYLFLFEQFYNADKFKSFGYNVVKTLGSGKDGTVYLLSNGKVLKSYDNVVYLNDINSTVENLNKAKGKKFKHLAKIFDYKYDEDDDLLFYVTENLDPNPILEYQNFTEYHIDFFSDFYSTYLNNNSDFDKSVNILFDSYSNNKDEDSFDLNRYTPEVKENLLHYYKEILNCIEEAFTNGFEVDPVDDNIMVDPKTGTYKLIDYLG